MYKVFDTLEDLYAEIVEDKNWTGAESATRNRYPLRFVLFERFEDCNAFTRKCTDNGIYLQSIDGWLKEGTTDVFITYSQMAKLFGLYVKRLPANDFVIAPFSEIARFYDNETYHEFDSLLIHMRGVESPAESQVRHQRLYVPVIGMHQKFGRFKDDPNIHIWEYRSGVEQMNYRLILARGTTYGVKGLEEKYTVCHNLKEWVALWKKLSGLNEKIICSSVSIFNNAHHAKPDNAFDYTVCNNVFEFLTDGLGLDFSNVEYKEGEEEYWNTLAEKIHVDDFRFDTFVEQQLGTTKLKTGSDFVNEWFDNNDAFMRWLLCKYFLQKDGRKTYLGRTLGEMGMTSTSELFSQLAVGIFDEQFDDISLRQRNQILEECSRHNVVLSEMAEFKIKARLEAIATNPELGHAVAMRYVTSLTLSERLLLVKWLGEGKIERSSIRNLFPQLYDYLSPFSIAIDSSCSWINEYFEEYCKSKTQDRITDKLSAILNEKNKNAASFYSWYNDFKTVKTALVNRKDIELYFWIDGLGVDWIPYITHLIERHNHDGVYLNEVMVATAQLPTITSVNKVKLDELCDHKLAKAGCVDEYAHDSKRHPEYIVEEFRLVDEAIEKVLLENWGKKIAFVSDHGISYLANKTSGLSLAGVETHHAGRYGVWRQGKPVADSKYVVLEDGVTLCSLTHNSLSGKTPEGTGAHGGATPEEVLVPIIVVSGQKNASTYSAKLVNNEVSASMGKVQYVITGINGVDAPCIDYNGVEYKLQPVNGNLYESERIYFVDTVNQITIRIADFKQSDKLIIKSGFEEEDLFGGL